MKYILHPTDLRSTPFELVTLMAELVHIPTGCIVHYELDDSDDGRATNREEALRLLAVKVKEYHNDKPI